MFGFTIRLGSAFVKLAGSSLSSFDGSFADPEITLPEYVVSPASNFSPVFSSTKTPLTYAAPSKGVNAFAKFSNALLPLVSSSGSGSGGGGAAADAEGKAPVASVAVVAGVAVTGGGAGLSSSLDDGAGLSLLGSFADPEITLPVEVVPPASMVSPVASSTRLPFT